MSQFKEIIHVGGYGITPSDIGSIVRNFPSWSSEGTSSPDLSRTKKPTIIYQTNLPVVSAANVLTVTHCDLMINSAIGKRVKAWYDKGQKGRTSDKGWVD